MLDPSEYDFIDFGASKGGSIKWASGAFGGRGFGIDIDPKKIEELRKTGAEGLVADATALDLPDNCVRYVTMINFLEHLPSPELGEAMIESAVRVASDFVFILGPDFEGAAALRENGLKKYFADWSGHTWHHRTHQLAQAFGKFPDYRFMLIQTNRIHDSYNHVIHPINATRNSGPYDANEHPEKPFIKFKQKIFGTIVAVLAKHEEIDIDRILMRGLGLQVQYGKEHDKKLYT
ncbi:class I SAM-dependent methyltransferase [Jiella sonneratiae]|uniref:Class I SAM-dependent methyltransferase n=1 Tax=Jiella sonneratiae TaxID=2816856 RepID=A0ABS3JBT8_9HYPH|nr:class I SAM-dependent methyltransferase [Jiella sonneratiae]MBO0906607.1 class I SAM-dependent methyltransferase [Jiella sonneratiae]